MMAGAGLCVAILAAIMAGGCGESTEPSVSASDARELARLRPVAPGWAWPAGTEKAAENGDTPSKDPLLAEFRQKTKGLTDLGESSGEWQDGDKLAHVDVAVYQSAADAHRAFAPFNELSLGWARRSGGFRGQHAVGGLGEEAWLLRQAQNGEQVTFHWREANLIIEAHMHCFGSCPSGLAGAARAWAERIDVRARALR